MKNYLFILTLLWLPVNGRAQDVIVKRDGSTILSRVLQVDETDVEYKKWGNLEGDTYVISVNDILSINYENGEKDEFGNTNVSYSSSSLLQTPALPQKKKLDPRDYDFFGLFYKADFDAAGRGYYGVSFIAVSEKGIGVNFGIGWNYGLVSSSVSSTYFCLGPSYLYPVNETIFLYAPLSAEVVYDGHKFFWGASITPSLGLKITKKLTLDLGIFVGWAQRSDNLSPGFSIGIRFL